MDVRMDGDPGVPVATDDDGNFTGYWEVLDEDTLSLGDYTINVTDSEDLMVQLSFSIVAARVDVEPRKALFDRGDTISFDISNDFDLPDSYIEIYSPDDTLYWITELFDTGLWVLVGDLYTVPYYRQLANANPMDLASDAPMGTWMYFFYDVDDEELMNGTIEVGPSTAAQVDALLEDVRSDLSGLSDDVAGLGGEFDTLSDEIGDVASDLDTLRDGIVGDLAGDIADATAAANAAGDAVDDLAGALDDLGDSVGDIADTANTAADAAAAAADAANDAVTAAEDASQSASGLTTLVYGAIGASLIAALAAIVSLMQISRRIAG
jgi:methyl-accepting chemotaxis protein